MVLLESETRLLDKYRAREDNIIPPDGCWTNFLGVHTCAKWFPMESDLTGRLIREDPDPNDGAYGGAGEYLSLLTAIDYRAEDRTVFSAIELGAGWGPWISAAGVTCKRLGFNRINLVGVEAECSRAERMVAHMRLNGLLEPPVHATLIRGAAWRDDGTVYFPASMPMHDYGGAASDERSDIDYRGFYYAASECPAYSLETICKDLAIVDYAHWDVQGAEATLARSSCDILKSKVRYLFVGTHSRKIEGDLLDLFYRMRWDVVRHDPCAYRYDLEKPSLEAMGSSDHSDGGMFFRNPALTA